MQETGPGSNDFDVRQQLEGIVFMPNAWRDLMPKLTSHQKLVRDSGSELGFYDSRRYLNELLTSSGLAGQKVHVSGKVRPTLGSYGAFQDDIQVLPLRYDDKGGYRLVDRLELTVGLVDSRYDIGDTNFGTDENPKFGITFHNHRDPSKVDIKNSGPIIMYPEDVYAIKFDALHIGAEEWIEWAYPELYERFNNCIPSIVSHPDEILSTVKNLQLRLNSNDRELPTRLSHAVSSRIEFGQRPFEISVDGPIAGIDLSGEIAESEFKGILSQIDICKLVFVRTEASKEEYIPAFECLMPSGKADEGHHVIILPIDSILEMNKIRSMLPDFSSKLAIVKHPKEEVYTTRIGDLGLQQSEGRPHKESSSLDREAAEEVLGRANEIVKNAIREDLDGNFIMSIDHDIGSLLKSWNNYFASHAEKGEVTSDDMKDIINLINKHDLILMKDLQIDNTIQTRSEGLAIGVEHKEELCFNTANPIRGRFKGVAYYVERVMGRELKYLAVILEGAYLVSDSGDLISMFRGNQCIIPLTGETALDKTYYINSDRS